MQNYMTVKMEKESKYKIEKNLVKDAAIRIFHKIYSENIKNIKATTTRYKQAIKNEQNRINF